MNLLNDNRRLAAEVNNQATLDKLETVVPQMVSYIGNPVETLEEILREEPNSILAHALRAHAGGIMVNGEFYDHVRRFVDALNSLVDKANDREPRQISAISDWLNGHFGIAIVKFESALAYYLRNRVAMQVAYLLDSYRGESKNLRERIPSNLPHTVEDSSKFWYALTMRTFGLELYKKHKRTEDTVRKAVELNLKYVWGIYGVGYVVDSEVRKAEPIIWNDSRVDNWFLDNGFSDHNRWHQVLYNLDLQQNENVIEVRDKLIAEDAVELGMFDVSTNLLQLHIMIHYMEDWQDTFTLTQT